MPNISMDQIRDLSIKAVEGFLNDKIPLSEGIAKQASYMQLNSEQIQRSVEATNSIAYLKVLSLSPDRTIEFDLCKYAEVMAHIALPEESDSFVVKQASVKVTEEDLGLPSVFDQAEINIAFVKQAAVNEAQLGQLKDRAITIVPELTKAASIVKADREGLQKLSAAFDGNTFSELSSLVFGSKQGHTDTGIFKRAELNTVIKLNDLYKEAQELQSAIKQKQSLHDKSEQIKQAGLLSSVGFGLGKAVGSVAAAPFKMLGKGIKNSTINVANKATDFARDKIGMPAIPRAAKFGIGAIAAPAAMAVGDSLLYSAGKNKDTGTSKDVWSALQRQ